jgi:hypothetical protein
VHFLSIYLGTSSHRRGFRFLISAHACVLISANLPAPRREQIARWFIFEPNIKIWVNFDGLGTENVGIFYDHLEYFTSIWYYLWPFDMACGHLVKLFPIWYVWTKKNLATLL